MQIHFFMKKQNMNRRDLLKAASSLSSFVLLDSVLANSLWIPSAYGNSVPLESLRSQLSPDEAVILVPSDKMYDAMQVSNNLRHQDIKPQVRVLCRTSDSVSICVQWAKAHNVPLAMRNGGHSYEGLSLSPGLVIDVRLMDKLQIASDNSTITTGGGALLGNIYQALTAKGVIIPAGTCPTVGISGHTTGGGYGLLARPLGLACDSLLEAQMIDAQGQLLTASDSENPDLFWALRGGGSGSFGVITQLKFKTHQIKQATTFVIRWRVTASAAQQIYKIWQAWASEAPRGITSILNCSGLENAVQVTLAGQSITTLNKLNAELNNTFFKNIKIAPFTNRIRTKTMMEAINQFSGSSTPYFIKGKSDLVKQNLTDQGLQEIFTKIPVGLNVIFDSYGGEIRSKTDKDTAFAHRDNTLSSVQYYLQWSEARETKTQLKIIRDYYNSLRPYMSGSAYFNYCDLDLGKKYASAYWGTNLPRLVQVKKDYDPENIFTHAQGIPLTTDEN